MSSRFITTLGSIVLLTTGACGAPGGGGQGGDGYGPDGNGFSAGGDGHGAGGNGSGADSGGADSTGGCSCGTGGQGADSSGGNGSAAPSDAYPRELLGTWQEGHDYYYQFSEAGECVFKMLGSTAEPCTYSVTRSAPGLPTPSQTWIVQVSASIDALEIIAIDPNQFTIRSGDDHFTLERVSDDFVRDCVGSLPEYCGAPNEQGCKDLPGCYWTASCFGVGDRYACSTTNVEILCTDGCSWEKYCAGEVEPCLGLDANRCETYPACKLQ